MWDLDDIQIQKILTEVSKERNIAKVVLKDEKERIVNFYGDNNVDFKHDDKSKFIDFENIGYFSKKIYYPYKGEQKKLGELEVYVLTDEIHIFLKDMLIRLTAISFPFLLLLLLVVQRTISKSLKPIRILTDQLNKIDERTTEEIKYEESNIKEITDLQNSLSKMKQYFDTYSQELEETVTSRTKELQDYRNHLEEMVEEKTKDLIFAKDEAEQAKASKSEFLANMSHELRTPMHAIISYSQMGIERVNTAEKDKLLKFYENINRSGKRLLHLLNDLLDLHSALEQQITQRKIADEFKACKSSLKLLNNASFTFRTLQEAKDVALTISHSFPDSERVLFGINELTVNAIEHGNLGIIFEEKKKLIIEGAWQKEIQDRLDSSTYANKKATITIVNKPDLIEVKIADMGKGFDYSKFLTFDHSRLTEPNGRGIAMTKMYSFDNMEYQGNGNEVLCIVKKVI